MKIRNFVLIRVAPGGALDQTGEGHLLGLANNDYFASSAWLRSEEEYDQIVGRSFGITTADDNTEYKEDKSKISLPTLEQLQRCWEHPKTCQSFKITAEKRLGCSFEAFIIASRIVNSK